ncbi:MAG: tripartite tricarboxylate transporter permease, partial [Acidiferrobacterales bacterium]|nr:tripartite tricarboxylate transporter permease [Acidiferrobacterales bacterium]
GAFLMVDLEPGPDMLTEHLDVTFSMVWIIVIANIITVAASFLLLDYLAKITLVRGSLIIPCLLVLIFLGSFATNNDFGDIILMLLFGILGYAMVLFRWPRPPLILGLVLGELSERYLFISVQRYGGEWLTFPGVLVILLFIAAALIYPLAQARAGKRKPMERGSDEA